MEFGVKVWGRSHDNRAILYLGLVKGIYEKPHRLALVHLTTDQKVGGSNPSGRATVFAFDVGLVLIKHDAIFVENRWIVQLDEYCTRFW